MLKRIKNFFIKDADSRVGRAWVTEVLPVFHDRAMTTNKDVWVVKRFVGEDLAESFRIDFPEMVEKKLLLNIKMLAQGGKPLKFSKKGKLVEFDKSFSKDGYKVNDLYSFSSLGYLGNSEGNEVVYCVADEYVFFEDVEKDILEVRSYSELERLEPVRVGVYKIV